jgi:hypothetical protein
VIDTIGLAYTRLLARPWIVLGPVLLDLYLWLGLRLTAGPLVLKIADVIRPMERIGESSANVIEGQEQFNLAELLSVQLFTIRMPTFLPSLVSDQSVRLASWRPEIADGPWWLLAALTMLLLFGGYIVGSAYLLAVGDVSRDLTPRVELRTILVTAYRMLLWVLASVGLLILLSWPLIVAQGTLLFLGSGLIGILAFLMLIPAGLGFMLFFFSIYAIVLDGATAAQSFRSSYRVVRAYGWQSLAFIVSFIVVTGGFPFVWRLLATVPPGTLIAIVGNAFVSTGMIVAGMIYYEDRAALVGIANASDGVGAA